MTNFFSDTKKIIDKVENEVNDAVDEAELEWTQEEVEGEEDEDRCGRSEPRRKKSI